MDIHKFAHHWREIIDLRKFVLLNLFFIFLHINPATFNELSRCCAGGSRHHRENGNCHSVKAVGSSSTCARAGSICCLRALIDSTCQAGVIYAQRHKICSTVIVNELAGGIKKECCDCCLLAKELSEHGEPCIAPVGFSPDCLNSFDKCCNRTNAENRGQLNELYDVESSQSPGNQQNRLNHGQFETPSCATANCAHLCSVRQDGTVQCSCRSGFDLATDARSCVDIDECKLLAQHWSKGEGGATTTKALLSLPPSIFKGMPVCDPKREICVNTEGGYGCRPAALSPRFGRKSQLQRRKFGVGRTRKANGRNKEPKSDGIIGNSEQQFIYKTLEGANDDGRGKKPAAILDVDECTLGAHDCGPLYQCRNTQGSFRCVPKRCETDQVLDPANGECKSMNCPAGYRAQEGRCEDIDECKEMPRRCATYEECVNIPGGFRCQEQGNVCSSGYFMDKDSGFCLDIDECQKGTHTCHSLASCINLQGTFRCNCPSGFEFNELTMRCDDIDECVKFAGHACSLQAICVNTIGSHECICKPGFKLGADNRSCEDIDECSNGMAKCQQKCINSPGSYQCICDRGYQLGIDEVTCEDINECAIWAKSGSELCMGQCINTPGSFMCTCPPGYEILSDGITCKDIDECAQRGPHLLCPMDQLCINLLGSFKCQRVECPRNYLPDRHYKNRVDDGFSCLKTCHPNDALCLANYTREILFQFRAIPSVLRLQHPIEVSRITTDLNSTLSVEYALNDQNARHYAVEQKENTGIVKLITGIRGPMLEKLRLHITVKTGRRGVPIAHNLAVIEVHVSGNAF